MPESPAAAPAPRTFLPEIQALRALAVGSVITFHLWPSDLPGGYVGVDVFFVISGFLITSHLLREVDKTGRVRLASFYARRMRRLLPASLLCLAVSTAAALWLLPSQLARAAAREAIASTLYVQNLWLAGRAVTYSASNEVASPVQHYWSLSAEEQFYLVWPALILLGVLLGRRLLKGHVVPTVGVILAAVVAASLVHSVLFTAADPAAAYFVTTTRAWEFGLGALASIVLPRVRVPGALAVVLRWAGVAAIAWAVATLSQDTAFPGAIALVPVLGTVAVIAAGDTGRWDPLSFVVGLRPVQWLGDVSYSAYLWHWPLIALGPFALGHALDWPEKAAILVATGVLAHASRAWVEQPFLSDRFRRARAWRTIVAAFVVMGALVGGVSAWTSWSDRVEQEAARERIERIEQAERIEQSEQGQRSEQIPPDSCFGALAAVNTERCGSAFAMPLQAPVTEADSPWQMDECVEEVCWSGERPGKVLAIVGDSHAQTLYHALKPTADAHGYGIQLFLQHSCPANIAGTTAFEGDAWEPAWCADWARGLADQLRAADPDVIITSASTGATFADVETGRRGYHETWASWTPIAPVIVVRDYPRTGGVWGPQCLASHADPLECAQPRQVALPVDVAHLAALDGLPDVSAVDLTDLFCDETTCYPVVGGLPVYYDRDHITRTFGLSMAPILASRITLP
ncbi:MAG: acyltransferase family protein [Propioniciclava sp.]|uniref:acyltransferase family protein n=1 Tax=Propioniciclava sp. TaxID=2038686 RepID=UPI0039E27DDF